MNRTEFRRDLDVDSFRGRIIRLAAGDPVPELPGGRMGVVGEAAGVVASVPLLAERAERLKVFYRDAVWVEPSTPLAAAPAPTGVAGLVRSITRLVRPPAGPEPTDPAATRTDEARRFLQSEVTDRWHRRQLTPAPHRTDVAFVTSDDFFDALRRENCELVSWPVFEVSESGVRTADGLEHVLDTLVVA